MNRTWRYRFARARLYMRWDGWWIERQLHRVAFPFQHPVLWWYCRRVDLHCWFGLPMPPPPEVRFPM